SLGRFRGPVRLPATDRGTYRILAGRAAPAQSRRPAPGEVRDVAGKDVHAGSGGLKRVPLAFAFFACYDPLGSPLSPANPGMAGGAWLGGGTPRMALVLAAILAALFVWVRPDLGSEGPHVPESPWLRFGSALVLVLASALLAARLSRS